MHDTERSGVYVEKPDDRAEELPGLSVLDLSFLDSVVPVHLFPDMVINYVPSV